MKILFLYNYYNKFLESFYSHHPEVSDLDFEAHRALLMEQRFGTSDVFSHNLKKLGHEAQEIVTNDRRLQMKWAHENGIQSLPLPLYLNYGLNRLFDYDWRYKIIKAQVELIKPDTNKLSLIQTTLLLSKLCGARSWLYIQDFEIDAARGWAG